MTKMNFNKIDRINTYLSIFLTGIDLPYQIKSDSCQAVQSIHTSPVDTDNGQEICKISEQIYGNPSYLSVFIRNIGDYLNSSSELVTDSQFLDDAFVDFLYSLFLGRPPENQETINNCKQLRIRQAIQVFFQSLEAEFRTAKGFGIKTLTSGLHQEEILIIGNCQAFEISKFINAFQSRFGVSFLYVNTFNFGFGFTAHIVESLLKKYKFIIMQELMDEIYFKYFSLRSLRAMFPDKVITFPNIYFRGLHPDQVYFKVCNSPLIDYHSSIALKLHYKNITSIKSSRDTSDTFKDYFASLKKDEIFKNSFLELKHRDERWDIKIFDFFSEYITYYPLLLTLNHPTKFLLIEVTRRIMRYLGMKLENEQMPSLELITTTLGLLPVWPIHDEISHYFGLRYKSMKSIYFHGDDGLISMMRMEDFVQESLKIYNRLDDELFVRTYEEYNFEQDFN